MYSVFNMKHMVLNFLWWKSLPISLIGRVNSIKMNILPKFIYLFQALPTPISKAFFKKLDSQFSRFLLNGKAPRVNLKTLCCPTEQGGLNLADFHLYYMAAQSKAIWTWTQNLEPSPAWKQTEQQLKCSQVFHLSPLTTC